MSAKSRTKGKRGELEVCTLARGLGFQVRRTAPMQSAHPKDFPDLDGLAPFWPEVKLYARTPVGRFAREHLDRERPGWVNLLAWRDNGTPWRGTLLLVDLLKILAELRTLRGEVARLRARAEPAAAAGRAAP